jgi:hypothetical protein
MVRTVDEFHSHTGGSEVVVDPAQGLQATSSIVQRQPTSTFHGRFAYTQSILFSSIFRCEIVLEGSDSNVNRSQSNMYERTCRWRVEMRKAWKVMRTVEDTTERPSSSENNDENVRWALRNRKSPRGRKWMPMAVGIVTGLSTLPIRTQWNAKS